MAQRWQVAVVDDRTGEPATETVRFALDGVEYEIDLSRSNAARLRALLAPYVRAGRRLLRTATRSGRIRYVVPRRVPVAADPRAVRAWARAHRIPVPERGRIPVAVIEMYHAAGH